MRMIYLVRKYACLILDIIIYIDWYYYRYRLLVLLALVN